MSTTLPGLQRALTRQMAPSLIALVMLTVVPALRLPMTALALGWGASWLYYVILGRSVSRLFDREGRARPHAGQVLFRQAVCLLALLLAFRWVGSWGWLTLGSMLVGRHWIVVAASLDARHEAS